MQVAFFAAQSQYILYYHVLYYLCLHLQQKLSHGLGCVMADDSRRLTALLATMAEVANRWDRLATYGLPSSPHAVGFAETLRAEVQHALADVEATP